MYDIKVKILFFLFFFHFFLISSFSALVFGKLPFSHLITLANLLNINWPNGLFFLFHWPACASSCQLYYLEVMEFYNKSWNKVVWVLSFWSFLVFNNSRFLTHTHIHIINLCFSSKMPTRILIDYIWSIWEELTFFNNSVFESGSISLQLFSSS